MTSTPRSALAWVVLALSLWLAACNGNVKLVGVCQPDPGQIEFGRDLGTTDITLADCSDSFKDEGDFAFVGIFPKHVTGSVVMQVTKDGGSARTSGGYVFSAPGNFYSGRWHLIDFPGPGSYELAMTLDGVVLATGHFTLTPGQNVRGP